VLALALYRHQSILEVAAHLDLTLPDEVNPDIAKSALTQECADPSPPTLGTSTASPVVCDERIVLG
jgi:hypothetical protein